MEAMYKVVITEVSLGTVLADNIFPAGSAKVVI